MVTRPGMLSGIRYVHVSLFFSLELILLPRKIGMMSRHQHYLLTGIWERHLLQEPKERVSCISTLYIYIYIAGKFINKNLVHAATMVSRLG